MKRVLAVTFGEAWSDEARAAAAESRRARGKGEGSSRNVGALLRKFPRLSIHKDIKDKMKVEGFRHTLKGDTHHITTPFATYRFNKKSGEYSGGKLSEGHADPTGHQPIDLLETQQTALREAKVDRSDGVIRHTVLITAKSKNGEGGAGRTYTESALRKIAQMSEGLPAYVNHVKDKAEAFKPRDIREIIGRHRNVRFEATEGGGRVVSDLHLVDHHKDWVLGLAEQMPDVVGNSLVSRGAVRNGDHGEEIVEDILAVRSGDLVSDPATTKGLFEHREHWLAEHRVDPGSAEGGGAEMNSREILEWIRANPAEGKVLTEDITAPLLAGVTKERDGLKIERDGLKIERDTLVKERDGVKTQLTEATGKLSNFEAADATRAKAAKLETALQESDLVKKHSKNEVAITPAFRTVLLEAKEDAWAGLIVDRVKVLDAVGHGTNGRPQSAGKGTELSEQEQVSGVLPEGTISRLAEALRG